MKNKAYPYVLGICLLCVSVFSTFKISNDRETGNEVAAKTSRLRQQHAKHLENSSFKETKHLSKQELKELRLPPDRYAEQLRELTMNPATGKLEPEEVTKLQQRLEKELRQKKAPGDDPNNPWIERGPNNVGGRTRALLFDPNDTTNRRVFSGGVSGGLWVNEDITSVDSEWNRVEGVASNLNVTSITVDPRDSNIWYLATGEQYTQGTVVGNGVYKSIDGGTTWTPLNVSLSETGNTDLEFNGRFFLSGVYFINKIIAWNNIEKNRTELFIGVGGQLNVYEGRLNDPFQILGLQSAGLYKSIDGGDNWDRIESDIFKLDFFDGTFISYIPNDFEIGADNKLWMSTIGQQFYNPNGGGRIFSTTNGDNWTEASVSPLLNIDRLELETSSTNPNKLYALGEGSFGAPEPVAIFVTTDGFNSQENLIKTALPNDANPRIEANDFTRGQGGYNLTIEADPTNDAILYVGGINLFSSIDNGAHWEQISKESNSLELDKLPVSLVHADHHAITFRPGNSNQAILGTDGGVFYAQDLATATTNVDAIQSRVKGYVTTQFVKAAIGPNGISNRSEIFSAGSQDNGTQAVIYPQAGANGSIEINGGDGGYTFIDKNGEYLILTTPANFIYRVDLPWNGSTDDSVYTTLLEEVSGDFVNPMGYDDKANFLLTNSSTRNPDDFSIIPSIKTIDVVSTANQNITNDLLTNSPTAFIASPYSDNTWLVGLKDGAMVRLSNVGVGTANWTGINTPFTGSVSSIRYGASDNDVLVTIHNYGVVSVWASSDAGVTWVNKEGDLPNIPVRDILQNPLDRREVIIATQLGVWKTINFDSDSPNWTRSQNGMSDVSVTSFDYWAKGGSDYDNVIIASTYGRGVFTGSFTSNPDDQAPTAPTNLIASNITQTTVDLSWTASQDNVAVTRYDVVANGNIVVYGINETNTTITGLAPNTQYDLAVYAYDAVSNASEYSETLTITTLT
ncbi:hypothetical protein AB832_00290, partial [Flavobacteriaceae bacterium (ex Bugula neritina AB1)]